MGSWAKKLFGNESIGKLGIVIAGTSSSEFENEITSMFDEVLNFKDSLFHAYLVRKGTTTYPLLFNVYGAPAMVDALAQMHDGGVQSVIFVGSAYGGFKNLEVSSYVIPNKSYHFDGIYHPIKPDKLYDTPDSDLKTLVESVFKDNDYEYFDGVNLSVPAVTFQPAHANEEYKKISPTTCEMELSACLSRAKDLGVRAVGILVISDNRKRGLGEDRTKRREAKKQLLGLLISNLNKFEIAPHPHVNKFKINEYLAWVIEDPDDENNVYRQ